MKKYVVLCLLALTGCQESKPIMYGCVTAFGGVVIPSTDPNVKVGAFSILLTQEDNIVRIPRHLCVEVRAK